MTAVEEWSAFWDAKAELPGDFAATGRGNMDIVGFLYTVREAARILELGPGQSLLDIGCGTGIFALALSPAVGRIHAVDLSDRMVERARRNVADAGNISVAAGSILSLGAEDKSFDKVLAYSVIQYLSSERDVVRALTEVGRVLRPRGRALLAANPDPARRSFVDGAAPPDREQGNGQNFALTDRTLWLSPERLEALAAEAGLRARATAIHPRIWQHRYMYDLVAEHGR